MPMTAKKKETFTQAMSRLEEIVRRIDNNELDIDELTDKIKEANQLIAYCRQTLTKAEKEMEKMWDEKKVM